MAFVALIAWLYWRAMLLAVGLCLLVVLATGVLVLGAMHRLADLTGHRTTIVLAASGDRFYWASLGTGFGVWSLLASLLG